MEKPQGAGILRFQMDWNPLPMISLELTMVRKAAGGFVTVMVPDLLPADAEMRSLYTAECRSLHEVRQLLEQGKL